MTIQTARFSSGESVAFTFDQQEKLGVVRRVDVLERPQLGSADTIKYCVACDDRDYYVGESELRTQ